MTTLTDYKTRDAAAPRRTANEGARVPGKKEAHGGNIFAAAQAMGCDWRDIVDFSANMNPLGVPASVRRALEGSFEKICHYPQVGAPALRGAAAEAWGVKETQVIAGNGATELLYFLARALKPRRVHLVSPGFTEYRRAFRDCEVTVTRCRAQEGYAISLPGVASDARLNQADLVVLANPNNPTGVSVDPSEIESWLTGGLPAGTRVVLDESFLDFTGDRSMAAATSCLPGLYVLRSLTKFYALPGLRLGCLVASEEHVGELEKVREPWQTNVLAEAAGVAALRDDEYRRRSLEYVETERAWLYEALQGIEGLKPLPSAANFLFVVCGRCVAGLQAFLQRHKILVRDVSEVEGVEGNAFRIAVRTRDENQRLLRLLGEFFR